MKAQIANGKMVLVLLTMLAASADAVDISVDRSRKYQIIEGFGFFPNIHPWKVRQGPFLDDVDLDAVGFFDTLISDLGATMIRCEVEPAFQADSGVWNYAALQSGHNMSKIGWFPSFRKFLAAAERHNEPLRLLGQVWSPPGWMKVNGESNCPGITVNAECRLKEGYENEFATHLIKYVETVRDSTGLDFYCLSFQDEPNFIHPFNSCTYTPMGYRLALTTIVPEFRNAGLATLFFGAEDVSYQFPGGYERAIKGDPFALSCLHAWAVHGYEHETQIKADTGSYDGATATQKPMWVTSGGASSEDWSDALVQILRLHGFLRNAKGSVWTWWAVMVDDPESESCLIRSGEPTDMYHTSRHYFRYIRPGARQVASTTSDTNVHVVAFYHEQFDCMSIVLVNATASPYTVDGITGPGVPAHFRRVVSTEDTKTTRDSVDASDDIVLPAKSITTLVSGTYRGTRDIQQAARPPAAGTAVRSERHPPVTRVRIYGLSGRLIATHEARSFDEHTLMLPARCAAGVYRIVTEGVDGMPVRMRTVVRR